MRTPQNETACPIIKKPLTSYFTNIIPNIFHAYFDKYNLHVLISKYNYFLVGSYFREFKLEKQ
jgi:hypothetical protein